MNPLAAVALKYVLIAGTIIGAYQVAPFIGVNAQRHRLETARDQYRAEAVAWHKSADGWRASFTKSEGFRSDEKTQARQAVEAETASCSIRVAEARRSAKAIRVLVDRPVKLDANQCPVREVVSADDLRSALGAR